MRYFVVFPGGITSRSISRVSSFVTIRSPSRLLATETANKTAKRSSDQSVARVPIEEGKNNVGKYAARYNTALAPSASNSEFL